MLDGGLRVSEVCTLQYSNFDLKEKTVVVASLKKRGKPIFRHIPMSGRLYEALAAHIKETGSLAREDYVFPANYPTNKEPHMQRKAVNMMLQRLNDKTPELGHVHPHQLRHTFATDLRRNGEELETIKDLLGHKKYDTTLIYAHISPENSRKAINKLREEKLTLKQRIMNLVNPRKASEFIQISSAAHSFTIGRGKEFLALAANIEKGINTLLIGPVGIGKTHLLSNLHLPDQKIIRFDDLGDIKKSLMGTILFLVKGDKEEFSKIIFGQDLEKIDVRLSKMSVSSLTDAIISLTQKGEYTIIIDSIDNLTPKASKVVEDLKMHMTIIAGAREVAMKQGSFLWNFEKISVAPLSRGESLELIYKLSHSVEVENWELYRNHIFEQSGGNPRVIKELVDRYGKEAIVSEDLVRKVRHFGSLKEFDMTFIVMIGIAGLALMRYMSGELGESKYRFIGGAAMILLMVSRFIFKGGRSKTRVLK
jgi:hypothetical protein